MRVDQDLLRAATRRARDEGLSLAELFEVFLVKYAAGHYEGVDVEGELAKMRRRMNY